ncbi:heparinase II/III family protein [Roseibaca sp. Y0-43]|uniref:heparinase II/III family protein n=1 Tax=Roseibaca sp. Y0-43 TaxID=2816854 RepID=UPI00351D0048
MAQVSRPASSGTERVSAMDRLAARWLGRVRAPLAITSQPEPRSLGVFARGQQMLAGNFLVAGELLQAQGTVPFDAATPEAVDELQGFAWLDHLAAVGDRPARDLAQAGLADWMRRYGRGSGPGWAPGIAGRRLIRLISHAVFLLQGSDGPDQTAFLRMLAHHATYLSKRAAHAAPGLPRIEARTGLLYAALSLEGWENRALGVVTALTRDCDSQIGADGGLATRNPEELLDVFECLGWAGQLLAENGQPIPDGLGDVMGRIAAALRCLRHADGGLMRCHGGGRGREGALAAALATHDALSNLPPAPAPERAMGYVRLAAGRTSVIADAAPPPLKAAPGRAHAATLAFELTSNRRPVIVSCGDGRSFGPEWHRASRATASHSTLALEGYSSARFGTPGGRRLELTDGPRAVGVEFRHTPYARAVALSHDGYGESHGLEHLRYLDLSADGRVLSGEDILIATGRPAQKRFDEVAARMGGGIAYALRFHLHPEVEASLDMNGTAVSLALRSGEIWVMRAEGATLALAPSVYLEKGRLKPRAAQQIVLSLRATSYTSQTNWTLAKAHDTPTALRDHAQDDILAVPDL